MVEIESGKRNVSSLELEQIARTLHRDLQDFLQREFTEEDVLTALFRATSLAAADAIPPRLRDCRALARERQNLEQLAGLERTRRIGATYEVEPPKTRWDAITQGERVADEERQRLGIGRVPIEDLPQLIESQGVFAAQVEFPNDVSGLTLLGNKSVPFVAVNQTHGPARRRFSFAHEYAHVILDHDTPGRISIVAERADLREVRANAFSAAFLMPAEGVREAVEELGKGSPSRVLTAVFDEEDALIVESRTEPGSQDIQLYDVVQLAGRFGVSPLAMIYRLKSLKIVSEPELARLREEGEGNRAEALQRLLEMPERPEPMGASNPRFVGLALEVFRREKITRTKLVELLDLAGVNAENIERLIETVGRDDGPVDV